MLCFLLTRYIPKYVPPAVRKRQDSFLSALVPPCPGGAASAVHLLLKHHNSPNRSVGCVWVIYAELCVLVANGDVSGSSR